MVEIQIITKVSKIKKLLNFTIFCKLVVAAIKDIEIPITRVIIWGVLFLE
jgi:hypothetical protein